MNELDTLLARIDGLQATLNSTRNWNQPAILEALDVEYTYDSNRIEGNTLTLRETDLVIHKGLTIGGKPLVEHLEAINHHEAVDFIRTLSKQKSTLTRAELLSLHGLVLRGIDKTQAGIYRQIPVTISGSQHIPPQPWHLEKLMEDYFIFQQQNHAQLHPVILAAEMHERLVTIHPFVDGNGRTARLVMNLILLRHGLPIAIISGDSASRLAYYSALVQCNLNNDKSAFHLLIAQTVLASQQRLLSLIGIQ